MFLFLEGNAKKISNFTIVFCIIIGLLPCSKNINFTLFYGTKTKYSDTK